MSLLKSLGYVTIHTADIDRWRQFAFGVLGFAEGNGPDPSALYLRMDERAARIIVVPGDGDRIATVGWEVRDHAALAQAIARSCEHKARIVERDPLEKGERALLNLGHTFGHAIETAQGYGAPGSDNLNHGEAVAVGMVLAARLSAQHGMAPAEDTDTLRGLMQDFGLPTAIPAGLEPDALLAHMRLDKKNIAGRLRLVLWRGIGRAEVVSDVDEAAVLAVLGEG